MLYTFILEYDGGTFVSQANCDTIDVAVARCVSRITEPKSFGDSLGELARILDGDGLTEVDGLTNVWCCTASIGDKMVIGNLIATDGACRTEST
jgi:hypothetical protein